MDNLEDKSEEQRVIREVIDRLSERDRSSLENLALSDSGLDERIRRKWPEAVIPIYGEIRE